MQRVGKPGVTQHSLGHRRGISRQPRTPGDLSAPSHRAGTADARNTRHSNSNSAVLSPAGEMPDQALESRSCCQSTSPAFFLSLGIAADSQTILSSSSSAKAAGTYCVSVILQSVLCYFTSFSQQAH